MSGPEQGSLGAAPLSPAVAARPAGIADPARLLEGIFAAVLLFVGTGAIFPLLARPHGEGTVTVGGAPDPVGRIYLIGFAIATALLYPRRRQLLTVMRRDPVLWLIPLLALASTVWSTEPTQTLRAAVALFGAMFFGAWLALRFDASEQLAMLGMMLGVTIVLSIALILADPSLGREANIHEQAWRGIYSHKNLFGRMMVLAYVVFLLQAIHRPGTRAITILFTALAVASLWMSGSRTALIVAAALTLLLVLRPVWRRVRVPGWLVGAAFLAVLGTLAAMAWSQRANLVGGDPGADTMTGRTAIWVASAVKVAQRPWLGYGFSAFWSGSAENYIDVWHMVNWSAPNAHDAYVDIALDLGLVGMVLLVWVCIRSATRSLSLQRCRDLPVLDQLWPSVLVAFTVLSFLTEGQLVERHAFWTLFTAAAVLAAKHRHHLPELAATG